jgi:Zn-finger nucleic acid-binding protein
MTNREHRTLCPLCDAILEHVDVGGTHIYKCGPCPFIGLEYYNDTDIANLSASIIR